MAKIKIGIVGCGGIANGKHFPALKNFTDRMEIVAFCDIVPERAQSRCGIRLHGEGLYGLPRTYRKPGG